MILGDNLKMPKKLEIDLSHDPTILLQDVHPEGKKTSMLKRNKVLT